ncbi:hypothetical protein AN639_01535 [Candidatus Epulonipiscium fishelsonii]|uniref:Uncharacterized protein n=1 Tax=Candidatus Epulonipiscium fishelsonii TaxID=77094 RepID=A0ACC8XBB2_9FIRM|nr:hypothetical protein AN639_01535 [Epulopiscium sp. SCG-B05WGA-EpuloA1]ONI39722.1 hypothetical protein AN396_07545 [Epulopiscium sp. SCG-B11WGA-EpuloA1]
MEEIAIADVAEETASTDVAEENTVYTGTGNGYIGEVKVDVTIENGTIKAIEVVEEAETLVIAERAIPIIVNRILEANSPEVDSVTGATMTSFAIKTAVSDAMVQAGLEKPTITFANAEKEQVHIEDVNTDIVVIGGGPSGLSAAITAKQTSPDAQVILVEKLDILSGNGKFDMNFYDLYNSKAQLDDGINYTKEMFLEYKATAGETPERLQVWADTTETLDAWLRNMGIQLNGNYGGETSTNHLAEDNQFAGEVVQAGLEKNAYEIGVDIRTGTTGGDLIIEDDRVVGVKVNNNQGENYNILAQNVIIATGGFSYNPELVEKYAPHAVGLPTSNAKGATGDYIKQFEELEYALGNMDNTRIFPTILSKNYNLTGGADFAFIVNDTGVTTPTGKIGQLYYITDQKGHDSFYRMQKHSALGYYEIASSVEELAEKLGIDVAGLVATVEEHNNNVTNGVEGFENKRLFNVDDTLYGAPVMSALHMTKGGVLTNENSQVLKADGTVVDGLYAAGEVTVQSGGYSQSVVFGKVAGQQAALTLASEN